jgi:hypothetical protein
MMSRPSCACLRTTSATEWRRQFSKAARSNDRWSRCALSNSCSSGGRIRLPTCVVRTRPAPLTCPFSPVRLGGFLLDDDLLGIFLSNAPAQDAGFVGHAPRAALRSPNIPTIANDSVARTDGAPIPDCGAIRAAYYLSTCSALSRGKLRDGVVDLRRRFEHCEMSGSLNHLRFGFRHRFCDRIHPRRRHSRLHRHPLEL